MGVRRASYKASHNIRDECCFRVRASSICDLGAEEVHGRRHDALRTDAAMGASAQGRGLALRDCIAYTRAGGAGRSAGCRSIV